MTISGGRTKQLDIFCRVSEFTSDFLSIVVVELIRFFHAALHLFCIHINSIYSPKLYFLQVIVCFLL